MPRCLRLFALVLLASLHAACAPVTFESQEARFDRDFDADSLTLELEYHDVAAIDVKRRNFLHFGSEDGPDLKAASGFLHWVIAGKRIFILADPFTAWDLEGLARDQGLTDDERTYIGNIFVDEARVDLGESGEINVYQRIVFPDASQGLALLNASLRRELLAAFEDGELQLYLGDEQSAASAKVAISDAKAGRDWITWDETGLVLTVPMSSKFVLSSMKEIANQELVDALRKKLPLDDQDLAELERVQSGARLLLGAASDFRIESDHVVLVFGDENADIKLRFGPELLDDLEDYRPALREHLKASGFEFPSVYRAKQ